MTGLLKQYRRPVLFIACVLALAMFLFFAGNALAQTPVAEGIDSIANTTGLSTADPRIIVARVIRAFFGVLGIVVVLLIMYAGFLWMTSEGNPAKIEKAQKIMINAGIGLVIILSSLAITQFVLSQLLAATTGQGNSPGGGGPSSVIVPLSSSLGAGIIEQHFPRRNAQGVPRNTNIVVTFREAIDPSTILDGFDPASPTLEYPLNADAVQIYATEDGFAGALTSANVLVNVTEDHKTFVFNPVPLLGNAAEDVDYSVNLTGDIELETGGSAFAGISSDGYLWRFTVSTEVDLTPPRVTHVIPVEGSDNPRNILLQVHFSEAVNPISAAGMSPAFTNIQVREGTQLIEGEWTIGNEYQTSEFVSNLACGTNSCGETVFCLPPNATLSGLVKSGALSSDPPMAIFPYAGVVDMAGNALDGNDDGEAGGSPADDMSWAFSTTNDIVLDPPQVVDVVPSLGNPGDVIQGVDFDQPIQVTFDSLLSTSSLSPDNVILHSPANALWYSVRANLLNPDGSPASEVDPTGTRTQVEIRHGVFSESVRYAGDLQSGLQSIYQNCFTPSSSNACVGPNCCNNVAQGSVCTY